MATHQQSMGETVRQGEVTYTASDDETLSEAVIAALRTAASSASSDQGDDGQDIGVLTPLFETVDPDALNSLFSSTYSGTSRNGTITFTHDGYDVTATGDGHVVVSSE
ncbi:hypothetical protein GCU68_15645 [Natronorubrum aibiense]|uniref:Halobacterial output domain-containing protein n=2 Tax=Natronorubrum aibiense TaxID=348826 RepID=A0A5P9P6T9_9EURY|nr:hypothetical protein GCU68_15645 [Natronorubrum aibiense]